MPSICVQSVGRTGKLPRMGHVFMYGGTQDWDQRLLDKAPNPCPPARALAFTPQVLTCSRSMGPWGLQKHECPTNDCTTEELLRRNTSLISDWLAQRATVSREHKPPGKSLGCWQPAPRCFCCCSAVWLGWYPCVLQSQQTPQHTAVPVVSALLQPSQSLKTANCFHLICSPTQGCYILSEILIKLQSVTIIPLTFWGASNHLLSSLFMCGS